MTSKRRKMSLRARLNRTNDLNMDVELNTELETVSNESYSDDFLSKLNSMRKCKDMCDYEIKCNEKTFYCHKFVLISQSDFFRTMLSSSLKESKQNFVDLKGFNCSHALELVLDYLYTGSIQISLENILNLLEITSHLQINDLLNIFINYLIKNLSLNNCVYILKLSETFCLKKLNEHTLTYLSSNLFNIYKTCIEQFSQLTLEHLKYLLNSSELQIYSELELFLMLVKWIEYPNVKHERFKHAHELISKVRFMCMSAEELADFVEPVAFMKEIAECNLLLINAYRYHALPRRQPLITCEQSQLRNQEILLAVGENSLYALNELKQKWEIVSSAPLEDNYPYPFSVLTYNNYLYVLGSRKSSSEEYRSCYRFSPKTLEWTQLAPLIHDRSRFGAAIINNYIYVFGGFEGFKRSNRIYLNTIDRYSIEEDKWEQFCEQGPLMSSMASCTFDEKIYFGGGKNLNWSKISDFYSIDLESKSLIKKSNMLLARTTHQIIKIRDLIYVYGGFDDAGNGILSIESYNVSTDQWSLVTSAPGSLSKTWPQSIGFLNGRFYISVFHTPNTFKIMQKGYFYDIDSNVWIEGPVINERARYCPTCSLAFPKNVYKFEDAESEINLSRNESINLEDNNLIVTESP